MISASAPGKIILFGEHAVVYGQPALAVPVAHIRATATVEEISDGIWIDARDLQRLYRLEDATPTDPLAAVIRLTFAHLQLLITNYALRFTLHSSIPLASGLGSGAAICTALVRAIADNYQLPITNNEISSIVFETERMLHGTPSGIDNTVVAHEQPVYFIKGQAPRPFTVAQPFHLLIADTGLPSPTKLAVGEVRAAWEQNPDRYNALFHSIGEIARAARAHIESGQPHLLGPLMTYNHALLREMGVSCSELETLIEAALSAGALGAKLSGGGRGGNMLALVTPETQDRVRAALEDAGAERVITTVISYQ
jgi:mevalonate kinase